MIMYEHKIIHYLSNHLRLLYNDYLERYLFDYYNRYHDILYGAIDESFSYAISKPFIINAIAPRARNELSYRPITSIKINW